MGAKVKFGDWRSEKTEAKRLSKLYGMPVSEIKQLIKKRGFI